MDEAALDGLVEMMEGGCRRKSWLGVERVMSGC